MRKSLTENGIVGKAYAGTTGVLLAFNLEKDQDRDDAAHPGWVTAGLEAQMAQKINATTITLPTCHLAMLQKPQKVAEFIEQAATSIGKR